MVLGPFALEPLWHLYHPPTERSPPSLSSHRLQQAAANLWDVKGCFCPGCVHGMLCDGCGVVQGGGISSGGVPVGVAGWGVGWASGWRAAGLVRGCCCQVGRRAGVGWSVIAVGVRQGVLNVNKTVCFLHRAHECRRQLFESYSRRDSNLQSPP